MNAWDSYSKNKATGLPPIVLGLIFVLVLGAFVFTGSLLFSYMANDNSSKPAADVLVSYSSSKTLANSPSSVNNFIELPSLVETLPVFNLPSLVQKQDNQEGENGLIIKVALPTFAPVVYKSLSPGPSSLQITNNEPLPIGMATFVSETDTTKGAAGEWRVPTWWQPGWIPESNDCGEPGNTIIAGHVSWYKRPGPFQTLGTLTPGDMIQCMDASGHWHTFEVVEVSRTEYTDTSNYWRQINNDVTLSTLTLYTCTPEVDGIIMIKAQLLSDNLDGLRRDTQDVTDSTNTANFN